MEAKKRAKLGLLISEVIKKDELKVDDDRVRASWKIWLRLIKSHSKLFDFLLKRTKNKCRKCNLLYLKSKL